MRRPSRAAAAASCLLLRTIWQFRETHCPRLEMPQLPFNRQKSLVVVCSTGPVRAPQPALVHAGTLNAVTGTAQTGLVGLGVPYIPDFQFHSETGSWIITGGFWNHAEVLRLQHGYKIHWLCRHFQLLLCLNDHATQVCDCLF